MRTRVVPSIALAAALALGAMTSTAHAALDTCTTWKFNAGAPVYSSPAYNGGFVYIGSDNGNLYCLDGQTGAMQWSLPTGGLIRCRPAIVDSTVIVESEDGFVYAANTMTGAIRWTRDVGNTMASRVLPDLGSHAGNQWDYMQSSPCVDSGVVYIGSGDSSLYALNAQTGAILWRAKTGNVVRATPCILGGLVYVGSWDHFMYAFHKADGSQAWKFNMNGIVQCSPRIANGIIYCGARDGYMYAIDAVLGTQVWKTLYSGTYQFLESTAIVVDSIVYVGSSDSKVIYAFHAVTGQLVRTIAVTGDTWSSPIHSNGILYIGQESYASTMTAPKSGGLLAIDLAAAKVKWLRVCGTSPYIGGVVSSPTLHASLIYYGGVDGYVYALDTAYTPQPEWCAADFSSGTYDKRQGFFVPSWSPGTIRQIAGSSPCLQDSVTIGPAHPAYGVQRDSLLLVDNALRATAVSFSFLASATVPYHGIVALSLVNSDHDSIAVVDTIGIQVPRANWTTLWLGNLDSLENAGAFDRSKPATVSLTVTYPPPYDTTHWTGKVFVDNLVVHGIPARSPLLDGIGQSQQVTRFFHLEGSYPNPFNPETTIEYRVAVRGHISLDVFDMLGRTVATLVSEVQNPGSYKVKFDGRGLASGVYYCRLMAGGQAMSAKMVLLK